MMRYEYPTLEETLALHDRLIDLRRVVFSRIAASARADAEFLI